MLTRLAQLPLAPLRTLAAARRGLIKIRPCYWIRDALHSESVVVDAGLGPDADFSQEIMARYGATCCGFDPTRKHEPALQEIERSSGGRFRFFPLAIAGAPGAAIFYESAENVSGSLARSHVNVRRDSIRSYEVRCVTLAQVFDLAGSSRIDLLKLDIEGAEYDVIESATRGMLRACGQIVIEFHHGTVAGATRAGTRQAVAKLEGCGFTPYTRDFANYLFFRREAS